MPSIAAEAAKEYRASQSNRHNANLSDSYKTSFDSLIERRCVQKAENHTGWPDDPPISVYRFQDQSYLVMTGPEANRTAVVAKSPTAQRIAELVLDRAADRILQLALENGAVKRGDFTAGGPATGAYPMAAAIALASLNGENPVPGFVVRDRPKSHGTTQIMEGHLPPNGRAAVVDDVCTTGASLLWAIQAVETQGCDVVKVAVILDRNAGGGQDIRNRGRRLLIKWRIIIDNEGRLTEVLLPKSTFFTTATVDQRPVRPKHPEDRVCGHHTQVAGKRPDRSYSCGVHGDHRSGGNPAFPSRRREAGTQTRAS